MGWLSRGRRFIVLSLHWTIYWTEKWWCRTRIQMKLLSRLIRIVGDYLGAMLSRDLSVQLVIQLGNITLEVDQNNPDGSIASESSQVKSSSCTVSSSGRRGSRVVLYLASSDIQKEFQLSMIVPSGTKGLWTRLRQRQLVTPSPCPTSQIKLSSSTSTCIFSACIFYNTWIGETYVCYTRYTLM